MLDINTINFEKQGGLIPVIIQDATSFKVLMLGYMNREALNMTLETKMVWFFSRSRNRLWQKGETSGNYLYVKDMKLDCDQDSLLISVKPAGPVCHRGTTGCFGEESDAGNADFLYQLENIIQQRASESGTKSYTRTLLDRGIDRIAQKVGEEAVEVVIAAKNNNQELLRGEIADLLYHLLVLMHAQGTGLDEVSQVLRSRHDQRTAE